MVLDHYFTSHCLRVCTCKGGGCGPLPGVLLSRLHDIVNQNLLAKS